ncbi:uncharacterized protein LOC120013877 [Tripterygium wilfordii]|uniref:uncharacterized protein LOC120013877 n=1 Tax=Tripterygium wilfordii TaxID=458696 RepID=UPI0018F83AC1|nr:uncharacterized protein LOC120013877 [Tripterygium wilfordii]
MISLSIIKIKFVLFDWFRQSKGFQACSCAKSTRWVNQKPDWSSGISLWKLKLPSHGVFTSLYAASVSISFLIMCFISWFEYAFPEVVLLGKRNLHQINLIIIGISYLLFAASCCSTWICWISYFYPF